MLVRLANTADADHNVAAHAVAQLHRSGAALYVSPQNLVEFRNVSTRPKVANGLGLTCADAVAKADGFEAVFSLLPETADIYPAWKEIVVSLDVIGKQVHDARLVAVAAVHRLSSILTFNTPHFLRLTSKVGIAVVSPTDILR